MFKVDRLGVRSVVILCVADQQQSYELLRAEDEQIVFVTRRESALISAECQINQLVEAGFEMPILQANDGCVFTRAFLRSRGQCEKARRPQTTQFAADLSQPPRTRSRKVWAMNATSSNSLAAADCASGSSGRRAPQASCAVVTEAKAYAPTLHWSWLRRSCEARRTWNDYANKITFERNVLKPTWKIANMFAKLALRL